jgi:taurine dioxygenase
MDSETYSLPRAAIGGAPASRLGLPIEGLDVARLDAAGAARLRDAVWANKLVVLRGLELSDEDYIALARKIGEPQIYFQHNYHHPRHPEIFVSSNVPMDGRKVGVAGTGRYWHSDYQFFDEPLPFTMVAPRVIPPGNRGTCFIDMEAACAALPAELRRFTDGTRAIHEAKWRYKVQPCDVDKSISEILEEFGRITPAVTHPTVIMHPVTGRRALYVSRGFTVGIEGLGHEEGRAALERLFAFIERPEHVFLQPWAPGDILLWDNRQVIHMSSGSLHGAPSRSYRIGVYDGLPFHAGRRAPPSGEQRARYERDRARA